MSIYGIPQPRVETMHPAISEQDVPSSSSESSSEEITLDTIIREKPPTKEVREFFRQNLAGIKSEEEELFDG